MKCSFSRRKQLTGYIFVLPWIIGSLFCLVFPLLFSFVISFVNLKDVNFFDMSFAGFEHYKKAFVMDVEFLPMFLNAVYNTIINTPLIIISSLIIAIMLSRKMKGRGFFRLVFFLPVLLGTGFVMEQILGQNVDQQAVEIARGILLPAKIQAYIGPDATQLIGDFFHRMTIILWKCGVQVIISLAGIQGISPALYESSRVDGATEWEMFWKITLPMMAPILLLNTIYTIIASFMENSPLMAYIQKTTFNTTPNQYEYASAMGWIYFGFILIIVALVFLFMKPFVKRVAENEK